MQRMKINSNYKDQPAVGGIVAELAVILRLVAVGRGQFLVADQAAVSLSIAAGAGQVEGLVIKEGSQAGKRIFLEGGHQLIEHRVRPLDVRLRGRDDRAEAEVTAGQG